MHWLDVTLLVVLAVGALFGARSGLLWQVARLVTFALALYVCVYFHDPATAVIATYLTGTASVVPSLLAYAVLFLAVYFVLYGFTLLLQRALKASRLKALDRVLGAGFGSLKAALLSGAVLMGVALCAFPQTDTALADSAVAPLLLQGMQALAVAVPQNYKNQVNEALQRVKKAGVEKAHELQGPAARKAMEEQLRSLAPGQRKPPADAP